MSILHEVPETWPLPSEVAGISLIDSALAGETIEFVREHSAPIVFNHAMRTYLFAELLGQAQKLRYDRELLFLGCLCHDLGQTPKFLGEQRFEVDGADAACAFLRERNYPPERSEVVWDAIALHTCIGIVNRKRPEISLVSAGAGLDLVGMGLQHLHPGAVQQVVAAFPRPDFNKRFPQVLCAIAEHKPQTCRFNLLQEFIPNQPAPTFRAMIESCPLGG